MCFLCCNANGIELIIITLIDSGLHNDSSVIFVGEMSPDVSSSSVIYVGTTQAKAEPNDGGSAVKEEANNNDDDAGLSQILNSFLTMNLNSSEYILCNE